MDGPTAANIAREAARGQGTYFTALSNEMCWDAVAACQGRVLDAVNEDRGVDVYDRVVKNANDMLSIPEGATIGFFERGRVVHVMIGLGRGEAAGNKNATIGLGSPVGWEKLDLMQGWKKEGTFGPRNLAVRYRPLSI